MNKNPFEFWSFRDVRKEKFPLPKLVDVPIDSSNIQKKIKILLSHHYLIPREQTPKVILDFFKTSLTIENPEFKDYVKFGKGFVPKHILPFVHMYVADSKYLGIPRSIEFEKVIEAFKKQNIEVELEDIRPDFGKIDFIRKPGYSPIFYQKEAIDKVVSGNITLKFFCGRGKTAISLLAVDQIRMRTLILVRTNQLIKQWLEEIHNVFEISDDEIGIINGDSKTEGKITIASVQSLITMSRKQKQKFSETYGHVICDEAHEVPANQYFKFIQIFKCRKITGLTATPIRSDGKSKILACYVGKITKVDDAGVIPVKFDLVETEFDFRHDGRRNQYSQMLEALIEDEKRNKLILKKIQQYLNKDKIIFVYSCRIKHLEILKEKLEELRPDVLTGLIAAETSSGKKIAVEEQETIRKLANSEHVKVIFGTQIIKQGFNVKPLSAVIVATPAKSIILIEQLLGREQREYKEKNEVYYIDFIDKNIATLKYQFFYKNKNIFKKFRELSEVSREASKMPKEEKQQLELELV